MPRAADIWKTSRRLQPLVFQALALRSREAAEHDRSGRRAQSVQKLREEQKQRLARPGRANLSPFLVGRFDEVTQLNASDLDVVLQAVADKFLKDDVKKRLSRTTASRDRHLQIVRFAMDQLRREREAGTKTGPRLSCQLISTIVEAIPDEALKSRITGGSGLPREMRRQLGQVLGRSILAEWKPEVDVAPATPAQIEETTDRLLAGAATERRENVQQRLQTENGRRVDRDCRRAADKPAAQETAAGARLFGSIAACRPRLAIVRSAARTNRLPRQDRRRRIPALRNPIKGDRSIARLVSRFLRPCRSSATSGLLLTAQ